MIPAYMGGRSRKMVIRKMFRVIAECFRCRLPKHRKRRLVQTDGLAFSTESRKGLLRVWVTDVEPREDITIQITVQEVLEV